MPENLTNKAELGGAVVQSADLHLFVYDRALHPELFRHYLAGRVEQTRYHADISIIGLGHVVTVTVPSEGKSLTELISRDSDVLPTRGVVSRFRLKGERDHERRTAEGWGYMVSTQVETMDDPLYKSVHMDLLRHASKRKWHRVYDAWGDGELLPFSFIDHEARDGEFHVHAFHAFPAERTIVKTQSIFELPS